MTNITTTYYTGDLINGNLEGFSNYLDAYSFYQELVEDGNKLDNEFDSELKMSSKEFHYVLKSTKHYDEDGEELPHLDEEEFLD